MGVSSSRADASQKSKGSARRMRKDARGLLTELLCYHPNVNNSEEALQILDGWPPGTFILRNCSGKHEGFCAASVVVGADQERMLRHFNIRLRDGSSFCFERRKLFKTLEELVAYYGENDVPNSRGVTGVRLVRPRPRCRAPAPLPQQPQLTASGHDEATAASYSYATHKDLTDDLISNLEQQQLLLQQMHSRRSSKRTISTSSNGGSVHGKCECGLRVADAVLPGGWTVHQSVKERVVFYKDPAGTSCWELPADIKHLLVDQQRVFIKRLTDRLMFT